MGGLTVIGIVGVLLASIFDYASPVPKDLVVGGGPTNLLVTVGVNAGIFVLFVGLARSMYGNLLRRRWQQQAAQRETEAVADGGSEQ